MTNRLFTRVWDQLRGKKPQLNNLMTRITVKGIRGIRDLTVPFDYPVCVLAGPNGCGKSTILFACACAYDSGGKGDLSPAILFPNLATRTPELCDVLGKAGLYFDYIVDGAVEGMDWKRGKNWDKSYRGRKGGRQPVRTVYFRTLAELTSPSEVRSVLQIGKRAFESEEITVDLISMAQRVLSYQYSDVKIIRNAKRDLLFASREDASVRYSEFHMSAGERSMLRLSKDISRLHGALILIDEIEAGLHPSTQQSIMLELQRLALRNDLQIILTSHSPIVLDCVPPEGRIFLERTKDNVVLRSAYKTIIQKAYYGQSLDKLSILCEDESAEAIIRGCMDYLNPKLELIQEDIVVGRNTGKKEFPAHIKALAKFNKLSDFIFVLDGDARGMERELRDAGAPEPDLVLIFLPGLFPEAWVWELLLGNPGRYANEFGIAAEELRRRIDELYRRYASAADPESAKIKACLNDLCEALGRPQPELIRKVSFIEANSDQPSIHECITDLENRIRQWISAS